jgi:hypothetical protein
VKWIYNNRLSNIIQRAGIEAGFEPESRAKFCPLLDRLSSDQEPGFTVGCSSKVTLEIHSGFNVSGKTNKKLFTKTSGIQTTRECD